MPTNEELAGWNPDDGEAPNEHGTPVDPLDSDTDLDTLKERINGS